MAGERITSHPSQKTRWMGHPFCRGCRWKEPGHQQIRHLVVSGGWLGQDGQGYGVGGSGVVAEFQIETGFGWAGESEGVSDETLGDCGGGGEVGVGGDGVNEVETGAGDGAGLCGVSGAVEVFEGGESDEGDQREPVAGGAVGHDGAEAEGAEGGGSKGPEGVEGGEEGVVVLQNEAAGGDAEGGVEALVSVGDLDGCVAGEGLGGFEREGELLVGGKVILVGEVDGVSFGLVDALAEQSDAGARRGDGDRQGEGAAVFEGDLRGEVFAGMELGWVEVIRKGELEVFFGCGVGVCRRWSEGEVVEDELLDLVEAGAGELGGDVSGVVGEGVQLGGLGVVGEADGVGLGDAVLLDGEVESARVVRRQGEGDVDGVGFVGSGLEGLLPGGAEG